MLSSSSNVTYRQNLTGAILPPMEECLPVANVTRRSDLGDLGTPRHRGPEDLAHDDTSEVTAYRDAEVVRCVYRAGACDAWQTWQKALPTRKAGNAAWFVRREASDAD
jgi:hypothetical protein